MNYEFSSYGGIAAAPKLYWQKVAQFAKEHGILLAVDEVNQGMGRTGTFFSYQRFGLHPDLIVWVSLWRLECHLARF